MADRVAKIAGAAEATSAWLIAELGAKRFSCARQAAAHVGLAPIHRLSGDSVRGKPRLPREGNARLRKALYWPAISAMRYNPLIRAQYQHLLKRGKLKKVALTACMRKFLTILNAMVRARQPFRA